MVNSIQDPQFQLDLNFQITGVDREFQQAYVEKMEDCYSIAQSIPQDILNKNPVYKKFGRNMIFFKCQHVSCILNYECFVTLNDVFLFFGEKFLSLCNVHNTAKKVYKVLS